MKKPRHKYKKEIEQSKIISINNQKEFYCVNLIVEIIVKERPFL